MGIIALPILEGDAVSVNTLQVTERSDALDKTAVKILGKRITCTANR